MKGLPGVTGIDLNRAGTPLIEIVSEPDMRSAKEAVAYMKKVHTLVRYLDICDGNMQEGSFRCDANVSVRKKGAEKFGTRAEIKNLNSFRFVEKAINYEVQRQIELIESRRHREAGNAPLRLRTRARRAPCAARKRRTTTATSPTPTCCRWCWMTRSSKAFVPRCQSCQTRKPRASPALYGLSPYDAGVLTASRELAAYYEDVTREVAGDPKLAANWVMGDLAAALNKEGLEIGASRISSAALAKLLRRILDNTISGKIAKEVFEAMWATGQGMDQDADAIIEGKGLRQITDTSAIEKSIDEVMAKNPGQLADYRGGKDKLFGFFVGQVMKATGGKANPAQLNELLKKKLAP